MASLMSDGQREAFVRRVRLEMAKGSMTREALAKRAACKERTLGNLLAGQPVRDVTVAKIARVLGIDLEDFMNGGATAVSGGRGRRGAGGRGVRWLSAVGVCALRRHLFRLSPRLVGKEGVFPLGLRDRLGRRIAPAPVLRAAALPQREQCNCLQQPRRRAVHQSAHGHRASAHNLSRARCGS